MTLPLKTWWHQLNTWEPDAALAFYGRTLGWQFEQAELHPMAADIGSPGRMGARSAAFLP
jgi:predicted enzyme related to lactoylglutathione lyase